MQEQGKKSEPSVLHEANHGRYSCSKLVDKINYQHAKDANLYSSVNPLLTIMAEAVPKEWITKFY